MALAGTLPPFPLNSSSCYDAASSSGSGAAPSTPGAGGRRHARTPSSASSGGAAAAALPEDLAGAAQALSHQEAELEAQRGKAAGMQQARHAAQLQRVLAARAELERRKRLVEASLMSARNQAALLQAHERQGSGEARAWEQAEAEVAARLAAARAAAEAEYAVREAAAQEAIHRERQACQQVALELAALRRAATLELQQLQSATGVTCCSGGEGGPQACPPAPAGPASTPALPPPLVDAGSAPASGLPALHGSRAATAPEAAAAAPAAAAAADSSEDEVWFDCAEGRQRPPQRRHGSKGRRCCSIM